MNDQSSRSSNLRGRATAVTPGGVHSNVRLQCPEVFFERAAGAWLWDVDGKDYVDYMLAQGPAFLGHAHPAIVEAVNAALPTGILFGAQHALEVEAAEAVLEALGWAEQMRFGLTGTEAVQAALRLARAATGRRRFVRFEGHYHGWLDNVLTGLQPGPAAPISAGQLESHVAECVVVGWNDLEALERTLQEHDDIAAVLTEPMMINSGAIVPRDGYLEGVRELCDRHGVVLIFDEVITGFRLSLGGAAARFGVQPDLATYGKAMAGGFPVAALAGREELFRDVGTGVINHSGTFNGNAMGCAATIAALRIMLEEQVHEQVEKNGRALMEVLTGLARDRGIPLHVQGLPMAFHMSPGDDVDFHDLRGVLARDTVPYLELVAALHERGVWVAARDIWYVSAAHGDHELEETVQRFDAALADLAGGEPGTG